jgi:tetratricopeptide (TPR) repeat protein
MRMRMRFLWMLQLILMVKKNTVWQLILCILCFSCQSTTCKFEPVINYSAQPHLVECLASPFAPLTLAERSQEWGKELFLGRAFLKELDYYRALSCLKRALFLIPRTHERRFEIEYEIFLTYYIANKYQEAVEAFESSRLLDAPNTFPALRELLIALYDAYIKTDQPERACRFLLLIDAIDAETANDLRLQTAIIEADFPGIVNTAACSSSNEVVSEFLTDYFHCSKSISTAKTLNAVLPGAGYLYVGQKKSAVTSFVINALFIAAAYQLFDRGYVPAGLIMTSIEAGWYFGGINGAGLEAKQYNEVLYSRLGKDVLAREKLFPVLMFQKGF